MWGCCVDGRDAYRHLPHTWGPGRLLLGTSAVFIRLMPGLSPESISFYRLLIAFLIVTLANLLFAGRVGVGWRGTSLSESLLLGALLGVHILLFTWSVRLTSILNATILVNTTPVWAMIMGYLLGKGLQGPLPVAGTFIAIGGVAVIAAAQATYSPGSLLGDVLAVLAAVVWAAYLLAGVSVFRGKGALTFLPGIYGGATLAVLVISLLAGVGLEPPVSDELAPLIGIALFPTALGHSLHFSSLEGIPPMRPRL
ncbi:MAG: DMT family transporter [Candidatus Caldarchaeales archaeon]|nr:DMT family transporter [Candidatus Caldarchaeales archaeon]MDT7915364.1 DMT family transporter [Candidatus Caldarchaeales archaeon]